MDWSREREYVGCEDQRISVFESRLLQGRQDGVRLIHVENGGNLSVSVLPDRGMDLYQVRYRGKSMNYLAPCGIAAPSYYNDRGAEWLRSFYVGFLTTVGLQHIGAPLELDGEQRGLHGRASSAPAENVRVTRDTENGRPVLLLEGTMREARIFGENLRLHRTLKFFYGQDVLELTDRVENCGFGPRQFLLGYHLNYGYPLLTEDAQLRLETEAVEARDDYAAQYVGSWREITPPSYPYRERCYFHKLKADAQGMTGYTLFNPREQLGVRVRYDARELPFFCQWNMFGKGEYVLGLEPLNAPLDGPKLGQTGCAAPVLEPGASKSYRLTVAFLDRPDAV